MESKIISLCLGDLYTNCYIIAKGHKALIIDPAAEYPKIHKTLEDNGLTVDKILLTHAHFDHIGALEEVRKNTGAKVYLHEGDAELLDAPEKNYSAQFLHKPLICDTADVLTRDGYQIDFEGEPIMVFHTPGHTLGSVIYIFRNMMFCGDTIFRSSVGRTDLYGGDKRMLGMSLSKLFRYFDEAEQDFVLLCGHGEKTMLSEERKQYSI